MTTTTEKKVSLKSLANNESKAEMYGKKTALSSIKTAYDVKEGNTRAYINSLGFSANMFKSLTVDMLDEYIAATASGRYSTMGLLNAIVKYAKANKIAAAKESKKQKKQNKSANKEAATRINNKKQSKGILSSIFGK
jgi:hypothetical protein